MAAHLANSEEGSRAVKVVQPKDTAITNESRKLSMI
jgi:hypothetical protein